MDDLRKRVAEIREEALHGHYGFASVADCLDYIAVLETRVSKLEAENEQLQVQLAGCGVAAFGLLSGEAKPGDYGWSGSYGDVVGLRRKYETLVRAADEMARDTQVLLEELVKADVKGDTPAMDVEDSLDNYRKLRGEG